MILIEIPEYQHYVIFVDPGVSTIKNNRLVYFLSVYLHVPPVPPLSYVYPFINWVVRYIKTTYHL